MIINAGCTYTAANGKEINLSQSIRLTDSNRHKFDSAMAEYLYSCECECDEWTGSVEWCEYVQRFGKRLLFEDDRGFVSVEKYPTEDAAKSRFDEIDYDYCQWCETEDSF